MFLKTIIGVAFAGCINLAKAQNQAVETASADSANKFVTLFSNGYVFPIGEDWQQNMITKNGLTDWKDKSVFSRTYFYPQQNGKLEVSLKLKSPTSESKISVMLDSSGETYGVAVGKSADFVVVPVGSFKINGTHYHCITIKGVSKTGDNFPAIESVVLSGEATKNLKYNISQYKGAPATHLRYEYPKDSTIAWFYSEITVPKGVDATNAYYMTNGFNGGYMGIQLNSAKERRVIFSIWSSFNTNDPKQIPADYAVNLIKKGKGVFTGEFGNEGSGGHSHLVFNWKQGTTYKMLVGAKPAGDHTIYSAYYYAPENGEWRLMAIWDKTKTGGKLLSSLYSFVENFGSNGTDFFKADYGNQWVCTPSGTWMEMTKSTFTTTADPVKHPRFDYGAGVENNRFYMFTGAFKDTCNVVPHAIIERKPNGIPPNIDFLKLPKK